MAKKTKEPTVFVAESVSKHALKASGERPSSRPTVEAVRLKYHLYAQFIDNLFGWLRTAVRVAGWAFVAYCLYRTTKSIAGQTTDFRADVKTIFESVVKLGASQWAAYAVAALCGVGYFHERRLRRQSNRSKGNYIRHLETKIDPNRSSSHLTETGQPSKEDRDAI